jgi:TPR repeat protein
MDDKKETGLRHTPSGGALSINSSRSSLLTRGLRDVAKASSNQHYDRALTDYRSGNFEDAATGFLRAAETGHSDSQYMLSTMYDAGQGLPQDATQATYWERKAAELGHVYAQANVSFRFYAEENFSEAFQWCQLAASGNLAWAQFNLGLMYRKGEGVARSDVEAAHWYRKAALQGHAEAQQKLADLYFLGQGVQRSYAHAAEWYRKAAEQGNAEAQFQLGHLYSLGQGVEHDYTQSRYWTRQASLQGHAEAMRELKRREYRDP